jgi:hypothetical protein
VSYDLLASVMLLQLALLLLMLVGVFAARLAGHVLTDATRREIREGDNAIGRWLDGEIDEAAAVQVISALGDDAVATIVGGYAGRVEGGRWEDIALLLRATDWFRRVRRRTSSRLWWRRLDSARALSLVAVDADLSLARALLGDRHHVVRLAAFRILGRVPNPELLCEVFKSALDAPPILRRYLFDILQTHDRAVVETVLETLVRIEDHNAVCVALEYVGETADPIYMDAVLELIGANVSDIRAAAAKAVAVFPHRRSATSLLAQLDDVDPDVRETVCDSLGRIGAVEAAAALGGRLGDADRRVRLAAGIALRRVGVPGVRVLRVELERPDSNSDLPLTRYILGLDADALAQHGAVARK